MGSRGSGAAWASLVAGVASVLTLPVAIYVTRYVESYDLIDAAWAIPLGAALGIISIAFSKRATRASSIRLGGAPSSGIVNTGRILGIAGICIALAGVVSLAVYGLLEYAGNRD